MAKKHPAPPAGATPLMLSITERAERVLISQGRAAGMLASMGDARTEQLAEFCSEAGEISPLVVVGVGEILCEYFTWCQEQKANVDDQDDELDTTSITPPAA